MQDCIICHCGKCKVMCNKHNKRAKCVDCGKRRMLGTAITKGIVRHLCNECCRKLEPKPMEEFHKSDIKTLTKQLH